MLPFAGSLKKMTFSVLLFTFLIILTLATLSCSGQNSGIIPVEDTFKVVTTIYPLADLIKQIGGDEVNVSYLMPGGVSPHTYEPTVEQAIMVNQADLIVYIGAGLDDWIIELVDESSNKDDMMLDLSKEVSLLQTSEYTPVDPDHGNSIPDGVHLDLHDEDGHSGIDPHYWLDPLLVRDEMLPVITRRLVQLLPEKSELFDNRLFEYSELLTFYDQNAASKTDGLKNKKFVSFHAAWQYFCSRYDLEEIAVIAHFPGQEPSAGWLAELINLIGSEDVGVILTEPQFSDRLAEKIAEETGCLVIVADPLGDETERGRSTYLEMMEYNLEVITSSLR